MDNGRDPVDLWLNAGLRYVELPTGTRALIRLPQADMIVRKGAMPSELRAMALKFATTGVALDALTPDDVDRFMAMKNVLIAYALRYLYVGDAPDGIEPPHDDPSGDPAWTPVTLSAADIEEAEVDGDDLGALGAIVLRQQTPNQITAFSRRDRGLMKPAEAARVADGEGGETVAAYAEFRGDRRGARAGDDGGNVGDEAERAARDRRPGHGARTRRSSLAPADR